MAGPARFALGHLGHGDLSVEAGGEQCGMVRVALQCFQVQRVAESDGSGLFDLVGYFFYLVTCGAFCNAEGDPTGMTPATGFASLHVGHGGVAVGRFVGDVACFATFLGIGLQVGLVAEDHLSGTGRVEDDVLDVDRGCYGYATEQYSQHGQSHSEVHGFTLQIVTDCFLVDRFAPVNRFISIICAFVVAETDNGTQLHNIQRIIFMPGAHG